MKTRPLKTRAWPTIIPMSWRARPKWEKWTLLAILAGTGILYTIGAAKNGYGNSFYAAAVQAGTHSWKAFFFGSLDASNYITVDKPPFALWVMEIFTRIFGFHTWSMLLPEVLAGVATVGVVYATVRRWFGSAQALIAAGVMALSPVAVLMFGFDNPDAILTLVLALSVYSFGRAFEGASPLKWLTLTALFTGAAFDTKMMQGLIVLPVLAVVYLCFAPPRFRTRLKHLLITAIPLLIACLWWPLIVSVTPATDRPYIGSSTNNSIWNLIIGYNGIGRLTGTATGKAGKQSGGTFTTASRSAGTTSAPTLHTGTRPTFTGTGGTGGGFAGHGPGAAGFGGSTGVLRIFNSDFGPNIAWFIPASLIGIGTVIWRRRRAPRTDPIRAAFLIWGGYMMLHIVVFSIVSGVIHPYYPVVMAPAVAALVGMSVVELYRLYRARRSSALLLPLAVAATGITATVILGYQSSWFPWLRWLILGGSLAVAVGLIGALYLKGRRLARGLLIAAAILCALGPVSFSIATVRVAHTGSVPTAGPGATGLAGSNNETSSAETALVTYLVSHRDSATWIVAVDSANESAPIQISSGQPVMAVGGFDGSDAAITLTQFKALVAAGSLRYYAVSSSGMGGGFGSQGNSAILAWVESTGTKVAYGGTSYTLYQLAR